MSQNPLLGIAMHLREQAVAYCDANKIPGYLVGIYHGGDQTVITHGVTNIVTGAPIWSILRCYQMN